MAECKISNTFLKEVYFFLILFFVLIFHHTNAQPAIDGISPWKLKGYAEKALRGGDIYLAIDYYEKYCSLKPGKIKAAYTLAGLYENTRNYTKAAKQYRVVYKSGSVRYIKSLYKYALMLKSGCCYDSALFCFNYYRTLDKSLKSDKMLSQLVANNIEGCTLASRPDTLNSQVKIIHLDTSINKAHVDFSPMSLDENTFVYASLRPDSARYSVDGSGNLKIPVREFYKAIKKRNQWTGGYDTPFSVNEPGMNVGNGVISRDGTRFYYTRCEDYAGSRLLCSIFRTVKTNGKWQKPEKLDEEINISGYTSTQPALGSNSKNNNETLYFVSDRKEGRGGLDIWYAEYDSKKGAFKTPKNCGGVINSPSDEITPFFDFDTRSLYFSSTWHPGNGGFDIFCSTGELKTWSKPENIGPPVNSCADDMYYVIAKNRDEGFFVSNRKGGIAMKSETCCDDIYSFTWPGKIKLFARGLVYSVDSNMIHGILNDYTMKDTIHRGPLLKNRMVKLPVLLYLHDKGSGQRFLIATDTTNSLGEYIFKIEPEKDYLVVADTSGFFTGESFFSARNINRSDTLTIKPIGMMEIQEEPVIIKNIYYPSDKSYLTAEAMKRIDTTLMRVLVGFPEIIVEISSHTDSRGNDNYNAKLSRRRAEGVMKYLISKGIARERLVAKGYGNLKPIAPDTNPDNTDNPEGRAKNRRTEFRIIGSLKDKYSKVVYDE